MLSSSHSVCLSIFEIIFTKWFCFLFFYLIHKYFQMSLFFKKSLFVFVLLAITFFFLLLYFKWLIWEMVIREVWLISQRTLDNAWKHFWFSCCGGGGVTIIPWVEVRDATKHLPVHKTSLKKACLSQNVSSSKVEKFCLGV